MQLHTFMIMARPASTPFSLSPSRKFFARYTPKSNDGQLQCFFVFRLITLLSENEKLPPASGDTTTVVSPLIP